MSRIIDYYFTPSSPWTYLGSARLYEIARHHGILVRHKPVDLLQVFEVSGGLPLGQRPPQRQRYRMAELKRWREYLDVPLTLEPRYFPVDPTLAAHSIIAADRLRQDPGRLAHGLLQAVWAEERNIAETATVAAIATDSGYDAEALLAEAHRPETASTLQTLTKEAIDNDVFGAPTYIIDGELFWGQDRLDLLERKLTKK